MTTEFTFPIYIFLYSLIAVACSLTFAPISIYLARRIGLIDKPGKYAHKIHTNPTPMAGGTALIFCLVLLAALLALWNDSFTRALIIATVVIYLFGLLDDLRGITALPKLIGQILASVILITSNISVHFVESLACL